MSELDLTALRGAPAMVLGASGFLGSNLVLALDRLGARVTAVARTPPARPDPALRAALDRAATATVDLMDVESVAAIAPTEGFLFLAAGLSGALSSLARATQDLEANGRGVLALLEALRGKGSRARVVFASSQLVYGEGGAAPIGEDAPPRPRSLYAAHKLLGESYGAVYAHVHGLHWVTLRMANPYGPRQRPLGSAYGIVRHFIDKALAGEALPLYGGGLQRRGYVFVDDVVSACLLAAVKAPPGRVYNVAPLVPCSVRDMAEAVVRACGRGRVESVPWPEDARRIEPGDFCLDVRRARSELGWEPQVDLDDGLARTVAFLRAGA